MKASCFVLLGVLCAASPVEAQVTARQACSIQNHAPSDAEAALAREEYNTARDLFGKMATTSPTESRAGLIRTLMAEDKASPAEALARTWMIDEPKSEAAVEMVAEALMRNGKIPEAFQANKQALEMDPCDARAYLLLAAFEGMTANYASSRRHVELAHRLAPEDIDIRETWIARLPAKKRREELALLVKDERLMNAEDRKRTLASLKREPASHKDECSVVKAFDQATIPIKPILDGPERLVGLALDVNFNAKQRRMEIDTGASGLVLSRAAALGLGLTRNETFESGGIGDEGSVATSTALVESVRIGPVEFRNCEVEILEKPSALDIDGLIGGDVFRKFLLTIDYPKRQLRLNALPARPDEKPENKTLAAGEEDEREAPHDRYIAPELKDWTRIYRVGHDLLLPVSIGDATDRLFIVDTGASTMLISPAAARAVTKVQLDESMGIRGISGEVKKVYQASNFVMTFARLSQKVGNMISIDTTRTSHNLGVEVSGFMGAQVLQRLAIHIDYRDNLIKFEYDPKNDR